MEIQYNYFKLLCLDTLIMNIYYQYENRYEHPRNNLDAVLTCTAHLPRKLVIVKQVYNTLAYGNDT